MRWILRLLVRRTNTKPVSVPRGGSQDLLKAAKDALRYIEAEYDLVKRGLTYPIALSDSGSLAWFTMIDNLRAAVARAEGRDAVFEPSIAAYDALMVPSLTQIGSDHDVHSAH